MSGADGKQDTFSWTTPCLLSTTKPLKHLDLRVAKSHFDMQQTSTGCATKQQRWSSEWTRTEAHSPVVLCRALWGLFIQPEQRRLWRLSATCDAFVPCCRGLRSPADWQWTAGKNSSGSSGCRPPPRLYRSMQSSSGRWDPRWDKQMIRHHRQGRKHDFE